MNGPSFTTVHLVPRTYRDAKSPIPGTIERYTVQEPRLPDMLTVRERVPEDRQSLRRESKLTVNDPTRIGFPVGGDQIRHIVRRQIRIVPTARTNKAVGSTATSNDTRLRAEHLGEPMGLERRIRREDELEILLRLR